MGDNIDLTLQSIRGVGWRPNYGGYDNDTTLAVSGIRAYVSFSGSVPNMKVHSSAMCPERGSIVIESNHSELSGTPSQDKETKPEIMQQLNTTFTDPFEEQRQNQRSSSSESSSSDSSSSSNRPHLQFDLGRDEGKEAEKDKEKQDLRRDRLLKLHITFRSVDGSVMDMGSEGVADLRLPETSFEGLPVTFDLPITQAIKEKNSTIDDTPVDAAPKPSRIVFEDSACIRVQLSDASERLNSSAFQIDGSSNDFVLSDHVDEIQLGGRVKKIHESSEIQKVRYGATKTNLFAFGNKDAGKKRNWVFGCNGGMDIKQSFEAFFDGMRGISTKCVDPEQELFTNSTMTSTIITRESLEI